MLRYVIRTLGVFARARFVGARSPVSRLHRRVRLSDIDFFGHMNQAVYAQVFELGRTDWAVRSGIWSHLRGHGINVVVAEQTLVYRRELKPGQRYAIDTRAREIEGRLLLVEGHLIVHDKVHAKNLTKLIFIGPDGVLGPSALPPLIEPFLQPPLRVTDWSLD